MRALITVPWLSRDYGGPSAKALHLAVALRKRGVETRVVGCGEAVGATGLPVLARFHANRIPGRISSLREAVRQADVIHVLGFREPVSVLTGLLAVFRRKTIVLEPVGTFRPRLRTFRLKAAYDWSFGRTFLRQAAVIIAASSSERAELIEDGVPADMITLRPNGVAVDDLYPLPGSRSARNALGIPESARLVVALGRLIAIKGFEQLPRALSDLPDDVWVVVAGPDEADGTLAQLRAEASRVGVQDRMVIQSDGVWGQEKASLLADAAVLCLPSQVESFGVAAAEAACIGIPVVCSDTCGVVEWLPPNASATFRYGDIGGLVKALMAMLEPQASVVAEKEATNMRERLSWDSIAEQQAEIYREAVLSQSRG